jgi:hypothetical protein
MGTAYIKNGTPVGTGSLCKTCSYAHIMTGYRESEQVTMCNAIHPNIVVPFLMYECSGYYDKNRPTWNQMQNLAIDVVTTPIKPVGFKSGPGFTQTTLVRPNVADDDDENEDD